MQHFLFKTLSIGNHTVFLVQFGINSHEWVFQIVEITWAALASAISAFWKPHKCKLIPKWTRKIIWLLNNINMKKFAWKKCGKIFLEAIFSFEKNFFKVFTQNFWWWWWWWCHYFMWYHWLRLFHIFFQPIIIQNYDV